MSDREREPYLVDFTFRSEVGVLMTKLIGRAPEFEKVFRHLRVGARFVGE
jgi:hypothetical protein